MARYLLIFCFLLTGSVLATAQGSLSGKVTDSETGEPILFGDVVLYENGVLITGVQTDFDGNYNLASIDPGSYEVIFKYVGYTDLKYEDVIINNDKETTLNADLSSGVTLAEVVVRGFEVPLVEQDNTQQGETLTSKSIQNLPSKNINGIISQVAGAGSADEGDAVSIRGSRSDGTFYYIDGIRVSGNLIPQSEIEQLQVITGGIGAKYGDVTGGIISITTKGPAAAFGGGFDIETSEYLDAYGYNLASAYLNGPLIKNDKGQSVLGYRFSGQYRYQEDDDPPATDIFRITDEALAELEANPVRYRINQAGGFTYVSEADYVNPEDVQILDAQPFEVNERLDLTAKIDARLSDAIDLALTGTFSDESDQFTPGENNTTGTNWRLLNAHNNPFDETRRVRANFRFRHRLGKTDFEESGADGAKAAKGNAIQNASYTLQFGAEQFDGELGDPTHGDNLFNYGHVGTWEANVIPSIAVTREFDPELMQIVETVSQESNQLAYVSEGGYTPGTLNPVLANYNNEFADRVPFDLYPAINGRTLDFLNNAHNFHTNVGSVYNFYRKQNQNTYTVQANAGFDLFPGGSEEGKHSIEFGFLYEQRINRQYQLNPSALWVTARQAANAPLNGIDSTDLRQSQVYVNAVTGETSEEFVDAPNWSTERIDIFGAGGGTSLDNNDFFANVRRLTGLTRFDHVNVDALSPDQLSLDMFTQGQLNDANSDLRLDYYGYDYLGNEFDGTFEDFFTATDGAGNLTRPVAPFRPTYTAAYVQDKFKFRDIIIRAGLRVDSYDANTRVLKDPYSLYELETASSFRDKFGVDYPGTIGDDFKVYVSGGQESTSVKAYRDGDTWYFPSGTQANNSTEIFGGTLAPGKRVDPDARIDDPNFDLNTSFADYTPQVNLMPRLAFSFPISEDANFFAHYDILVQRPPNNNIATALDYLNFEEVDLSANRPKANANLRPERTIDYEVGFQQKLSNSSALKIAAYYKELRDMIQIRILQNIDVITSYYTYDNLDFGTVKGFSFQYDLRRTGNVSLRANYVLQFADGTGSDANSSRGLGSREVLRVLYPLSFDERHRFNINLDYRYASGNKYNGPELFGKQIFANAGANLQLIAVSGRPYTATLTPDILGGNQTRGEINGSRLPFRNTINLRVDKDFVLKQPKEGKGGLNMNVYFRVANLLNTQNIIRVYSATGSAFTDGYLQSANGQQVLNQQDDPTIAAEFGDAATAYVNSYQWRLLNPNFLSLPRRLYLGVRMDF